MEWVVTSSGSLCSACQRPFGEREEYWSALYGAGDGFERKDFCGVCWSGPGEGVFSHWRTRCRKKPAPPRRFVDDSVLLDFFERLCESEDEGRRKLTFIMAVLLLRKRLLRERGRRHDGQGVVWTVEAPRLGKTFEVRDEGVAEPEVADILGQIGQVLNIELHRGAPDDTSGSQADAPAGEAAPAASPDAAGESPGRAL